MAVKSLTTVKQFLHQIDGLPLRVVERNRFGGLALMPTTDPGDREDATHLYHALEIAARKRGLRLRRGVVVWTVNGFAPDPV